MTLRLFLVQAPFGYTLPFNNYDTNMQQEAVLLGVVVQQLGYRDTMTILQQTMVYEQTRPWPVSIHSLQLNVSIHRM